MKKILTFVMAAIAMSFVACGSKTGSTAEPDSLAFESIAEEEAPVDQAKAIVALLQEQIQNADPEQLKAIGAQITEKIAEFIAAGDTEAAKSFTEVIDNFLTENAEKAKESGIATTVTEAISNVEGIPSSLVEAAQSAATGVATETNAQAAAVQESVNAAKEAIEAAPEAAKQAAKAKAEEAAAAAQQKAQESANQAIDEAAAAAKKKLGL